MSSQTLEKMEQTIDIQAFTPGKKIVWIQKAVATENVVIRQSQVTRFTVASDVVSS